MLAIKIAVRPCPRPVIRRATTIANQPLCRQLSRRRERQTACRLQTLRHFIHCASTRRSTTNAIRLPAKSSFRSWKCESPASDAALRQYYTDNSYYPYAAPFIPDKRIHAEPFADTCRPRYRAAYRPRHRGSADCSAGRASCGHVVRHQQLAPGHCCMRVARAARDRTSSILRHTAGISAATACSCVYTTRSNMSTFAASVAIGSDVAELQHHDWPPAGSVLTVTGIAGQESIVMPASYRLGGNRRGRAIRSPCLETVGADTSRISMDADNYAYVRPVTVLGEQRRFGNRQAVVVRVEPCPDETA